MTPEEEKRLKEIEVTATRIYPGRNWDQLTPDEQKAVYRAYEAERGYAAGLVNTPIPQGKTVGPYNIYVAPNWGEMAHYAVAQGLGGYLLGKAYSSLWQAIDKDSVATDQVDDALEGMVGRVNEVAPEFTGVANKTLKQADDYWGKFKKTQNPKHLETLDDVLRDAAGKADGPSVDYFQELRQTFRNGLPAGTDDALRGLDRSYRDFMTATRAGGYVDASEARNVFTPRQLLGASKARSAPRQTSTGQGSLQPEAVQGSRVITPPSWRRVQLPF
jgi:hypothetical protein